jgi:hypothetical protein
VVKYIHGDFRLWVKIAAARLARKTRPPEPQPQLKAFLEGSRI